jgi:hypothetical protein
MKKQKNTSYYSVVAPEVHSLPSVSQMNSAMKITHPADIPKQKREDEYDGGTETQD